MRTAEASQMFGTDEVALFDRPAVRVVRTTRGGAACYLLRVRQGASRSLIAAARQVLTEAGREIGERVLGDVTETEFEVLEPSWTAAA